MLKNATIFKVSRPVKAADMAHEFAPTQPTQERSFGWVPPKEHDPRLAIEVAGAVFGSFCIEVRKVPAHAVKAEMDKQIAAIVGVTGSKPGRKQRAEMRDDINLSLMPGVFPSKSVTPVIACDDFLIVGSTSNAVCDAVITALLKSGEELTVDHIQTKESPSTAMAAWLLDHTAPEGFDIGGECELVSQDESRSVVRYGRHPLLIDEVSRHLAQGKWPTKLALSYEDRVDFVLTSRMQLKKISFETHVSDGLADAWTGSAALTIGEIRPLLLALLIALGGHNSQ